MRDERRRPRPESAPATTNDESQCTCTSFGSCCVCADRRVEAWPHRRTAVELASAAEAIAHRHDVARRIAERRIAKQMMFVWGDAA